MRIFISLIFLLPSFLLAQYRGERTTEQSFEQSELYFASHFLNTFGIYRYKDIAPEFKIKLLLDPEFENEFRIAQWWLGFEAKL
jgi:hypothetical protein